MSSEELFLLIDSLQTQLPKCAIQVLLRLVAKCITAGTNQVDTSAAQIARELGMSEDSVKVARRALSPIVQNTGAAGVPSAWILPAEWFTMQRELFAVASPVGNVVQWPGNQGMMPWKPGQPMPWKPGVNALETRATATVTRASWTSFQGIDSLETRASAPENKTLPPADALETRTPSIDRDRVLSSSVGVLHLRDSIESVNWLPEELRTDGEQLKRWLRFFFSQTRPHDPVPDGPDEIIQAKCLALANLARLQHVLMQLQKKNTRPGNTWAWFVTVFCQRIKGTKETAQVPAPPAFRREKKTPSSDGGGDFQRDLVQETAARVGRM